MSWRVEGCVRVDVRGWVELFEGLRVVRGWMGVRGLGFRVCSTRVECEGAERC